MTANWKSALTPTFQVKEVLASGEERGEVRWPCGAEHIDSPVKDWRHVRDVDFKIDSVTGEAVFSFTRKMRVGARGTTTRP
jgi:hypothetical protein